MKKRYPFLPKNWLRFGLSAVIAAAFSLNLQAQTAPVKLWDKTIGGNNAEYFSDFQQTADGGYILGGYSESGISGDKSQALIGTRDYWVVKLDVNGNKLWDKTFGGNLYNQLSGIQQTSDGGYILGGTSDSPISGNKTQASNGVNDYWIVKLDASGNKLWDKSFGGSSEEYLSSLQQTSDGGYILGGRSFSGISGDKTQPSNGDYDYWIVKLDATGNKVWDKTYGGNGREMFKSIKQTTDGGYILGGTSNSNISGNKSQASQGLNDYWVIKLDVSGSKLWDKTYGGNFFDEFNTLQQTADGGYILGGSSVSGITGDKTEACKGNYDNWIVKIDAAGNKQWDKTLGGNNEEGLASIFQTPNGGYILGSGSFSGISGDKTEINQGFFDYWLLKLDNTGNKIWDKSFGGSDFDNMCSIRSTNDGGYIICGQSSSPISLDKTQASKGSSDYWIIKLAADITGIKEPEAGFNLSISPNPNQGKFNLQLSNLTAAKVAVTISDLLGRVVLQKEIQTNNNQLSEELTLPDAKGVYLLQLKAGEQIITRKIVVE